MRLPPSPFPQDRLTTKADNLTLVDLIYAHRPDRKTPLEETVRAFNHLISTGKALYWGTSEWTASEISAAAGIADRLGLIRPLMEQPHYNMLVRDKVEREFAFLYDGAQGGIGLGLTIFSPLKLGILTGKYNEGIPEDSRFATSDDSFIKSMNEKFGTEDFKKEIAVVKRLAPVAERLGCDQAALALAWVLKNPHISSAITGASKVEQVHKSMKAFEVLPKLTPEVMSEIDGILGNKPEAYPARFF